MDRLAVILKKGEKEPGYLTVRLTVRVDPPLPLNGQIFIIFLRGLFDLRLLSYMT